MVIIICFVIGLLSAMVGSIVGLGGGVILVPVLLILHTTTGLFQWADASTIVGISLIVMIFTAMSSTYAYAKSNRIDYTSGIYFIVGSVPGGILGSWLNQFVQTDLFSVYLGIFMLLIFLIFLFKKSAPSPVANEKVHHSSKIIREVWLGSRSYRYSFSPLIACGIAFLVGILSGFFGIGGGSLMVPAMILFFHFPPHIATATSMFMILALSMVSSVTHIALGHIEWSYVWAFIPGAWLGGVFGAKLNQKMSSKAVEYLLRIILLIIGIRLIWQGLFS
ncbi:sulfite exporter TauE/SafE family protein [Gracilibacillus caseinilyticus]|uniref:Probable membrane transporter protein n=1 Tax=Gracilibacillus caseinilyticus TaxID=2932256 RepID=A0ABY4EV61_9BACI|nr:sulfite exporter TauE/SafE family protein [Gracilibacillus caseinilyticus]UOQ48169.1 sulfite exporter TauE/SafE family protein [Gracilibacillus caseinilyticus]